MNYNDFLHTKICIAADSGFDIDVSEFKDNQITMFDFIDATGTEGNK